MPKYLLKDIVIKPKNTNLEIRKKTESKEIEKVLEDMGGDTNYNKSKPRYFLWVVAIISVIFCFFAISFLFSKANVSVDPKTEDVVLNENLSADKDSNGSGLSFDSVVIPGEVSKNVPVTGEKDVSTAAVGTVLIFNAFSSSPQNLNVDTRLLASNGKIYKTQAKTIVPGMSKDGTPGQVEVGIYAEKAGQEYNSTPLDFNILGFKGTPKYYKFSVRTKTGTTITGGFIGKAPDISPTDKATALGDLKTTLQAELLSKAIAQIPDGFILFKDAVFLNTDDSNLSSVYNQDNSATLTLNGTLTGIILSEKELTKKIAEDSILKYDESSVYIPNIKDLVFSLPTQIDSTTLADMQTINFNLSGSAKIVWKLDENKFMSDLLGKPKNYFSQVLSQYPNINSAILTITPVWKMSIPDQDKDVKVIVNYPK